MTLFPAAVPWVRLPDARRGQGEGREPGRVVRRDAEQAQGRRGELVDRGLVGDCTVGEVGVLAIGGPAVFGHNIDPRVIEEALLAHPAVVGAAAVGRPDRHSGEVPVAYVVPADADAFDEETLLAHAAAAIDEPARVQSGSIPWQRFP